LNHDLALLSDKHLGEWTPDDADQALNVDRINQRGGLSIAVARCNYLAAKHL